MAQRKTKKPTPKKFEQTIPANYKPYRPRKQVVEDMKNEGHITEFEAKQLDSAVIIADKEKIRGKYFLDLEKFVGAQKDELQKRIDKGTLSEKQKKLVHTLQVFQIKKPLLSNKYSISRAIDDYFNVSLESDSRPTINGLSLALGITKKDLFDAFNGKKVWISGMKLEGTEEIKNAIQVIATMNEIDIAESGGVGSMFLAKNFFGLSDKQEIAISKNNDEPNEKDIEDKYKDVDVIDV